MKRKGNQLLQFADHGVEILVVCAIAPENTAQFYSTYIIISTVCSKPAVGIQ